MTGRPRETGAEGDEATLDPTGPTEGGSGQRGSDAGDPGLPARIGPYDIVRELGRGGMGEVYEARDARLRRHVALKRVSRPQRGVAEARARFWREARALAAIGHPGIVTIYDIGETAEGDLYIAMELIDGRPLADYSSDAWPLDVALAVGVQLARALGAAHAAGITHRDIKPANVLVEGSGKLRVVDFGLARRAEAAEDLVTMEGAIVGTPAYMAPEQIAGMPVGPRSDVFTTGSLLYRLLAGRHPFARDSTPATAAAVATATCEPLATRCPELPAEVVAVIERCLHLDGEQRYPDGDALADALEQAAGATGVAIDQTAVARFVAGGVREEAAPRPTRTSLAGQTTVWERPAIRWGAIVAALIAIAGAWWFTRSPAGAPLDLPPRPVIAVVGVDGDADATRRSALADATRAFLDLDGERLVSVPLAAFSDRGVDPEDPTALVRPDRALGHVDGLLQGTLTADGVDLSLIDTRDGAVARTWSVEGSLDAPIPLARAMAEAVVGTLGGTLPDADPGLTSDADAYAAYLAAMDAQSRADLPGARERIMEALRLDPRFGLARYFELGVLRGERRHADLAARARELLADLPNLAPRLAGLTRAWIAYAERDSKQAVSLLTEQLDRHPWDLDAYQALLVLRHHDPDMTDLAEAEEVSRRLLAIAPRNETAISRLVRALAWRGHHEEATRALTDLALPRDDVRFAEIWAERALYAGDYATAVTDFGRALDVSDGQDVYAQHMLWATRILSGDCARAASEAMDRIDGIEAKGKDVNLDWTYSMALQALLCRGQWQSGRTLMERWAARYSGGQHQAPVWRGRLDLAEGRDRAEVAADVTKVLEAAESPRADLLWVLVNATSDPAALGRWAAAAETAALDHTKTRLARGAMARVSKALSAKAALTSDAGAGDEAWALLADSVALLSDIRAEGEHADIVNGLWLQADLLAAAGRRDEARDALDRLVGMAYPRLWATDLWFRAKEARDGD